MTTASITREVMIQRATGIREWMGNCDIHEDGTHDGATVIAFTSLESDWPSFRCVVRGLR